MVYPSNSLNSTLTETLDLSLYIIQVAMEEEADGYGSGLLMQVYSLDYTPLVS
jgi:hypothetical protein